ncbi:MAG: archaetidylserine decarboxylase [Pontibacterium sp.]
MKKTLFICAQHLLPQHLLSRLVGKIASCTNPWVKNTFIKHFAKRYQIDMSIAAEPELTAYKSFNDFFTRALREGVRPIDGDSNSIVSPADGAVSQLGKIEHGRLIQAKGRSYSLTTLLGGDFDASKPFINGQFATIYLSPKDYHRVHMPVAGTLTRSVYIPGDLYSVNGTTAENVENLFARNERLVAFFDTEFGPMAVVLVGAMIVAGIETVWSGQVAPYQRKPIVTDHSNQPREPITLEKGEEMGRFKLGSTAIVLFGEDVMHWQESLGPESPVTLGEAIGFRNTDA